MFGEKGAFTRGHTNTYMVQLGIENQCNFQLNFIWRARSKGSFACELLLSRKSTGASRRKKSIGIGGD